MYSFGCLSLCTDYKTAKDVRPKSAENGENSMGNNKTSAYSSFAACLPSKQSSLMMPNHQDHQV